MQYWKHVEAGDFESYGSKVSKYTFEVYPLRKKPDHLRGNTFWNPVPTADVQDYFPELLEGVSHFGKLREVTILSVYKDTSLHTDHTTGSQRGVLARLNIPVLNTEGSYTSFYEIPESYPFVVNGGGTKVWNTNLTNILQPVTTVEVIKPTILRVSKPHFVKCETNKYPRLVLSLTFEEDVVKYLDQPTQGKK